MSQTGHRGHACHAWRGHAARRYSWMRPQAGRRPP